MIVRHSNRAIEAPSVRHNPVELERMMKAGEVNVVDVRATEDYAAGHIPGAVNLPKDCHLAATAAIEFAGRGYPVMELDGG